MAIESAHFRDEDNEAKNEENSYVALFRASPCDFCATAAEAIAKATRVFMKIERVTYHYPRAHIHSFVVCARPTNAIKTV